MSWLERLRELRRIYNGERRQVRLTAVGWCPPGEEWLEETQQTPSGAPEFYRVIREGEREPEPATVPQRGAVRKAVQP